jgi:hypothetical protein
MEQLWRSNIYKNISLQYRVFVFALFPWNRLGRVFVDGIDDKTYFIRSMSLESSDVSIILVDQFGLQDIK